MKLISKNKIKIITLAIFFLSLYFLILVPFSDTYLLKKQYLSVDKSGNLKLHAKKPKSWLSTKTLSKNALTAIVISEDWAFYSHHGVDFRQIYHSLKDAFHGKALRGASTISQQVIKNIYFSSERSFLRKFYELFYTIFLEYNLSKNKILELYINLVELGPEVYGVRNASRYYFELAPSMLSSWHGAFLATMLPSPIKYSESFRNKELTSFVRGNMNSIIDKMAMAKYLSVEEASAEKNKTFYWEQSSTEFLNNDEEFFQINQQQ